MFRSQLAALGLSCLTGMAMALPTAPAEAAGSTTVTSPSCGVVAASNGTGGPVLLEVEFGDSTIMEAAERGSWDGLPGGGYVWRTSNPDTGADLAHGTVTVKPCTGGDVRPVEGDENRDGRADVLGVRRDDAKLYYYEMGSAGLRSGVEVGHGWGTTNWMQRVEEIDGAGSGRRLVTRRDDGTVWMYTLGSKGAVSRGRQVGSGFQSYQNLSVMQLNNGHAPGWHVLTASRDGILYGWLLDSSGVVQKMPLVDGYGGTSQTLALRDFDTDGWADLMAVGADGSLEGELLRWNGEVTSRVVGSGWTIMSSIYSPGDLTADGLPDIVARRKDDGHLYRYANTASGSTRVWSRPVRIGANWNVVRLFA